VHDTLTLRYLESGRFHLPVNLNRRIDRSPGKIDQLRMPPSFVMFDLRFRDAHPVYFPIDVVPSKPSRFRGCPKPTVAAQVQDHLPNWLDLGLDQASGHLSSVPFEPALVSASPGLSQKSEEYNICESSSLLARVES
jgi:hypothetical protein